MLILLSSYASSCSIIRFIGSLGCSAGTLATPETSKNGAKGLRMLPLDMAHYGFPLGVCFFA